MNVLISVDNTCRFRHLSPQFNTASSSCCVECGVWLLLATPDLSGNARSVTDSGTSRAARSASGRAGSTIIIACHQNRIDGSSSQTRPWASRPKLFTQSP
ncbi:hypothetical protein RRG08_062301 [Elysia crispata]|uniref:Uncharacterized protein n=1 Tax=Elysia crispata TaxID=231223 RepID=A0AAE1CY28_9GAST|nr:hypothetical protein RRG08_062301 [Elysia crispata]